MFQFYGVQSIFENARYNLIEACAEAIASALARRFTSIESVTVTLKKPSITSIVFASTLPRRLPYVVESSLYWFGF